jgi:hypothetical protein
VLRRIFGLKRDEVTGEWRKPHNEEINYLYGQGMWCVFGRGEAYTGFWWGNLRKRAQWGDPGVDGRIILTLIFRK